MLAKAPVFKNVMVIDDNRIDLYVTSQVIKRSNITQSITLFSGAIDALMFLQDNCHNQAVLPQIILVDIYMPEMSGFEFLIAYSKLPTELKAFCRVFMLSSSMDNHDLDRASRDENVVEFQPKPLSGEFLQKISTLYGRG